MKFVTSVLLCAAATTILWADETVKKPEKKKAGRVEIEGLLTAEPLPAGYDCTPSELKDDNGALLGHQLVFTKEGVVSKVMVKIENRKLPDRAHKKTTLKAYVNGTVHMFNDAGLKLVKKKLPDIEKVNVANRTTCDLVYQTAEGAEIDVQIQVFFTDVGYLVTVIADSQNDYKTLTKWAKTIQPAKGADKKGVKPRTEPDDSPSESQ